MSAVNHGQLGQPFSGSDSLRTADSPKSLLLSATLPAPYPPGTGGEKPSLPPALASGPDLFSLFKALKRRWIVGVLTGVFVAISTTVVVWKMLPPKFTARAVLHLASRAPSVLGGGSDSTSEFLMYQKTQSANLKGRVVLLAALDKPEVRQLSIVQEQTDPVEWLEKELLIDFNMSPELMRVSFSGKKPEEVVTLLNAVIEAYIQEIVMEEHRVRQDRLQKLKQTSERYEAILLAKRQEFSKLRETAGAVDPAVLAMRQQAQQERLNTIQKELLGVQQQILKRKAEVATLSNYKPAEIPVKVNEAEVEALLANDKLIEEYEARILKLEDELDRAAAQTELGRNHPKLQDQQREIDGLKQTINARRERQRPLIREQLRVRGQSNSKDGLAEAKSNLAILQETERIYQEDIQRLSDNIQKAGKQGVNFDDYKAEITRYEDLAKKYRQDVENTSLEMGSPPRVTLRDEAIIRQARDTKKQLMLSLGSGFGMFVGVLLGVAYLEFRAHRIDCVDDVTAGLGWRLIGTLPPTNDKSRNKAAGKQALMESIDATRTMLLHCARTEGVRSVMVTSAVAGEGKTSLSCHLAASLARAGRRTLLIDGDLRRPSAHRLFDITVSPGFSELLRGEAGFRDVIRATAAEGLWMIPAGKCTAATLQGLSGEMLPAILESLKAHYDFVVIDSSPVMPVADSLVLGQHSDVVLFSLLKDVSRTPTVHAAYQRLMSLNIRVLGAVMNGIDREVYVYENQPSLASI